MFEYDKLVILNGEDLSTCETAMFIMKKGNFILLSKEDCKELLRILKIQESRFR